MPAKEITICYFIVPFVGLVSYYNAIQAGFAYDDNRAIISNADVLPSSPMANIWQNDFWGTPLSHSGSHKSYRPLTVLTFKLNYIAGQLNPKGYHLVNVLLHSINSLLFFVLASLFFNNLLQCLVGSLLFAVHPIHTEAVTGVVGRADVLACLFFLISIILYHKGTNNAKGLNHNSGSHTRWRFVFASILSCIVAMLCKETGLTALAVCLIYDVIFLAEPQLDKLRDSFVRAGIRGCFVRVPLLLMTALLSLSWRLQIMDLRTPEFFQSDNPAANSPEFQTRALTFLYLPVLNFCLLLFPWQLSFDWSMDAVPLVTSFADARNIQSILFYAVLGTLACKFIRSLFRCPSNVAEDYTDPEGLTTANNLKLANSAKVKAEPVKQSPPHSITSVMKFNCMYDSGSNFISQGSGSLLRNKSGTQHSLPLHLSHSNGRHVKATVQNNNFSNDALKKQQSGKSGGISSTLLGDTDRRHFGHDFDVAAFSVAIAIVTFLPATNLFFYVGFVVAERILYMPSTGFCLLFAVGFGHVWSTSARLRPLLKAAMTCLLGLLMLRTVLRNEDWRDEEALYRSGLHINPAKAWSNLGIILANQGRIDSAEAAYRNALKARPNMADTHYNLGILLQNMKRYDESIDSYKTAIQFRPRLASAHLNLGQIFDQIGLKQRALEILQNARNLSDHGLKNPKAHKHSLTSIRYNMGKILFDLGKYKESTVVFLEAIENMPDSFAPHSLYNMLGQSYSFLGDGKSAEEWYLKSLRSNQTHAPAHLTYARHLASKGNSEAAELWYRKTLKLSPDNSDAHYHFAEFLLKNGRQPEGFLHLEKAVQSNPNQEDLVSFAASSFREAGLYDKAEVHYRKVVILNPKNPVCHMNLGALLHLTGRLDEAELSYLEADKLKPHDQLTLTNLRKLRAMRSRASPQS